MADFPIYLDYNGTTPIDPRVAEEMLPYLKEDFGNPSSAHFYGCRSREAVTRAREQLAALLGCDPGEVVFTSGGTESNNLALFGVAAAGAATGGHLVTSLVEHPAILEPALALLERGYDVTFVEVDGDGRVSAEEVEAALRADTFLVSIMHANNEVGTIEPLARIAEICRRRKVLLHCDAAQSVGKIAVKVDELGVDLLSVAGHKLYAPKGVGALYVRRGTPISRILFGAGQEKGLRPGTENVLEIVGLGAAAEIAGACLEEERQRLQVLRDRLQQLILDAVPGSLVHGHPRHRLPNTLSIAFPGLPADGLLQAMAGELAASAGAACHSDAVKVSHVLDAMRIPLDVAKGTIRFSLGRFTTEEEVDKAAAVLVRTVRSMRS